MRPFQEPSESLTHFKESPHIHSAAVPGAGFWGKGRLGDSRGYVTDGVTLLSAAGIFLVLCSRSILRPSRVGYLEHGLC